MNKNPYDVNESQYSIKRITWIGLAINILLALLKFLVGIIGKSQAVVADAFHSLSDMTTDFAVLFGIRFWDAPADDEHPYGHRRIQTLITIIIGIVLLFVAIGIGYKSIITLTEKHLAHPGWIALSGPFLSILLKEVLYRWTVKIGTATKSPAVVANAWHHRSDALSSIPVFISVLVSAINPDWVYFDHIGAFIVALFILKVSWDIIKPQLLELTEHAASPRDLNEIKMIVQNIKEVKTFHKIRTRKMGSEILLDLHIEVDPKLTVKEGHDISKKVKNNLIQKGPNIIDVVVHLEPYENNSA
ncbi:MAG: cation diffusion facilitator family transporter [Chlamydiota bacterium]|nr:cation diffusion facilitator family transporter [Chlamydiota bacterium]